MKFGAELEFTAAVAHAGGGGRGSFYDHLQTLVFESGIKNWMIEQDGSCGNEIVSPILNGDDGLKELLQVCFCAKRAAKDMGLSRITGVDCGIHFHFDASDMNHRQIRNVIVLTAIAETLFYAMNPISRFGTKFAAPLNFNLFQAIRARDLIDLRDIWFRSYMGVDANPDSFRHKHSEYFPSFINNEKKNPQKYDWTRYHGLNFVAMFKHGTIEFRYAHGSFDSYIVEMWYRLFESIVNAAKSHSTRTILKTNFPFKMTKVKLTPLSHLHVELYHDLRKVIKFLFEVQKGGSGSLIQPTIPMMQFIGSRLIKFSNKCIKPQTYKKLMSMSGEDNNPNEALGLLLEDKLRVQHVGFSPIHNEPVFDNG